MLPGRCALLTQRLVRRTCFLTTTNRGFYNDAKRAPVGLSFWHGGNGRRHTAVALTAVAATSCLFFAAAECEKQRSESLATADDGDTEITDGSQYYINHESGFKIFSGTGNYFLSNEIAMHLGVQLGRAEVTRFTDGECSINMVDSVRGENCFIIQPLAPPCNENLMELLLMISTLKRASAKRITAVIPYFGYSRSTNSQEKDVFTPVAAADVAKMLEVAGVDRVLCVDLHHSQIQGFFSASTPADNLDVSGIAVPYFQTKFLKNPVVISPDANGAARAKKFRDKLIKHNMNASLAIIIDRNSKSRGWQQEDKDPVEATWEKSEIAAMDLVGDVKGRDCVIYDDMIDSGGRVTRAAKKLKEAGALRVFAFTTHGLFTGNACERIEKSDLIEVVCLNTVPLKQTSKNGVNSFKYTTKIHQLSVAALLAESIRCMHNKKSISVMFS